MKKLLALIMVLPFIMAWTATSPDMKTFYKDYAKGETTMNKGNTVHVCHGSGCEWIVPVKLARADIEELKSKFGGVKTYWQEQYAISRAIAYLERRVCIEATTCHDKPGASWATSKIKGQLECVDETVNTNNYLMLMDKYKLLKYHKIMVPLHRYSFTIFPHWAARVKQIDNGQEWIVDSYFKANGETPYIFKREQWVKG